MTDSQFEQLMERWNDDLAFRRAFRESPRRALAEAGVELDEDQLAALEQLVRTKSDRELDQRLSMTRGLC